MNKRKSVNIALAGLFAAIICLVTAFVKIPVIKGYIHPGDGFIFLSVAMLGVYGIPAAAIGSGLADIISGFMFYTPATVIIKSLMAVTVFLLCRKNKKKAVYIVSALIAEIIMITGYFVYEAVMLNINTAFAGIPFNSIQAVGSIALAAVLLPLKKYNY